MDSFNDSSKNLRISFEIFPPKGDNYDIKCQNLFSEIHKLKEFNPSLISVTYGAGGSNRKNSLDIVKKLITEGFNVMPHFTCVCSDREYIENYITEIENLGINNILALRGDEPVGIDACPCDFKFAYELIDFIKKRTQMNIAVAGYPEKHPRAKDIHEDIKNLKKKIDLGGSSVYTQLFFDNTSFYDFRHLCSEEGIDVPIIPGILPITDFAQLAKMSVMCGVKLPKTLIDNFEKFKDNHDDMIKAGIEFTSMQVQELINSGVLGLHFYTLNKSRSVFEILENVL